VELTVMELSEDQMDELTRRVSDIVHESVLLDWNIPDIDDLNNIIDEEVKDIFDRMDELERRMSNLDFFKADRNHAHV
jgi:hypothetical protein